MNAARLLDLDLHAILDTTSDGGDVSAVRVGAASTATLWCRPTGMSRSQVRRAIAPARAAVSEVLALADPTQMPRNAVEALHAAFEALVTATNALELADLNQEPTP